MRSLLVLALLVSPAVANPAENLDREAISEGVGKVKDKVSACSTTARGIVKVSVDVAPSGSGGIVPLAAVAAGAATE